MQEEKDLTNILPIILFLIILIPFSIWFFSINQTNTLINLIKKQQ